MKSNGGVHFYCIKASRTCVSSQTLYTEHLKCIHFERGWSLERELIHFTVTASLQRTELENKCFKLPTNHCHTEEQQGSGKVDVYRLSDLQRRFITPNNYCPRVE